MKSPNTENGKSDLHRKPYQKPELRMFGALKEMTRGTGSDGNEGGGNNSETRNRRPTGSSDRLLKDNIVKIGTHPLGIGLYLFGFKPEYQESLGAGRHFGVMADEVERVMPSAVSVDSNGYKLVNYEMLGIYRTLH